MGLWQPTTTPEQEKLAAFSLLKQQAIAQFRQLGPVTVADMGEVVQKLSAKAPGLDVMSMLESEDKNLSKNVPEEPGRWMTRCQLAKTYQGASCAGASRRPC